MHCVTESLVDWADLYGWNRCWETAFWVDSFDSSAPSALGDELFLDTWMQIPLLCLVAEYRGRARIKISSLLVCLTYFSKFVNLLLTNFSDVVTWLILPVVICLSQRLSHACLSISTCTVKLRMAH